MTGFLPSIIMLFTCTIRISVIYVQLCFTVQYNFNVTRNRYSGSGVGNTEKKRFNYIKVCYYEKMYKYIGQSIYCGLVQITKPEVRNIAETVYFVVNYRLLQLSGSQKDDSVCDVRGVE